MLEENFKQKKANIQAAHKEENLILVIPFKNETRELMKRLGSTKER